MPLHHSSNGGGIKTTTAENMCINRRKHRKRHTTLEHIMHVVGVKIKNQNKARGT